jgi:2'-5' RNA ligase
MSGVRCFVALPLTHTFRELLGDAQRALTSTDPRWAGEKWVATENLHITLKFLGDVPEESVEEVSEALSRAVSPNAPFDLPPAGVRPIPNGHSARMLWATFADPSGACARLVADLEAASFTFGVTPDERAFKPHATLVRARRPRSVRAEALADAEATLASAGTVSFSSATFMASTLTGRGPVYRELDTYPLAGGS